MIEKARALIEYVEKYPWNNQYTRQARLEQENYVLEILNSIYREGFMDGEASVRAEIGGAVQRVNAAAAETERALLADSCGDLDDEFVGGCV